MESKFNIAKMAGYRERVDGEPWTDYVPEGTNVEVYVGGAEGPVPKGIGVSTNNVPAQLLADEKSSLLGLQGTVYQVVIQLKRPQLNEHALALLNASGSGEVLSRIANTGAGAGLSASIDMKDGTELDVEYGKACYLVPIRELSE